MPVQPISRLNQPFFFSPPASSPSAAAVFAFARSLDGLLKAGEELVRHLLGKPVDHAAAKLRDLAADVRLDLVGQPRAALDRRSA